MIATDLKEPPHLIWHSFLFAYSRSTPVIMIDIVPLKLLEHPQVWVYGPTTEIEVNAVQHKSKSSTLISCRACLVMSHLFHLPRQVLHGIPVVRMQGILR
ncbi:hypothetical protein N7456_008378 [Penicillium angulare]|uniref:Uncharacterized protein n=1 Tax=Penicillium angulare TaxID=116970 RepID=A0A9W9FCX9_9EURO|nr:hypothetical protein N7456_008378 [Penicillium angulare]